MKIITTFLIVFFMSSSMSHAQFISNDGEWHVLAGAVISATTYAIVYSITKNKKKAFWYSLSTSVLAGIAKEVYDSTKPFNNFDPADVAATSVGALTTSVTLSLFVGKRNRKRKNIALVN
ncbi:hypothetical protein QLS71_017080 [Mariniflexile litorale]|uniref:Uncharacterized protein n=1 Tax=Mariniflexile litorale TaxID=3045158 RepID=A0AAU7EF02_9FLAO|nr:hypothetical protein [Mariniflexile sp. KMM 9835]MDQ8211559.1 hypothetical protein [Mariniflexile sp. KMM 9835]